MLSTKKRKGRAQNFRPIKKIRGQHKASTANNSGYGRLNKVRTRLIITESEVVIPVCASCKKIVFDGESVVNTSTTILPSIITKAAV